MTKPNKNERGRYPTWIALNCVLRKDTQSNWREKQVSICVLCDAFCSHTALPRAKGQRRAPAPRQRYILPQNEQPQRQQGDHSRHTVDTGGEGRTLSGLITLRWTCRGVMKIRQRQRNYPLDHRSTYGTWPLCGGGQRRARCSTRIHRTRQHAHQPSAALITDALARRLT